MQSFHILIISYSPKRIGYKHDAYVARVQLAYLDHNHHLGRSQLLTKDVKPVFTRKWGRRTARWHVVPIPVIKTYSYIPRKFCSLEADLRLRWLGGLCVCVRAQNNMWGGPWTFTKQIEQLAKHSLNCMTNFAWTFHDHYRIILHMLSLASGHQVQSSVVFVMKRTGVPENP